MASRVSAVLLVLALGPPAASAADLGVPVTERAVALVSPGLWRGHFSGGRNYDPRNFEIVALDWTDQVAFFPDNLTCRRWIRDLRVKFATYQGFTGCLRIR